MFYKNFLTHYKILQKSSLYIILYIYKNIYIIYIIYSNKPLPIIDSIYLDDKTIIENLIKYYCKICYTKDYYLLYKKKFYESKIDNYILTMYLMKELLKSDIITIYEFYMEFINNNDRYTFFKKLQDNFKSIKFTIRNKHKYKMNAKFILYNIEDKY